MLSSLFSFAWNCQQNRLNSLMTVLDLFCCCLPGFTGSHCSSAIFENKMLGKCHSHSVPSSLGSSLSWHVGWDVFPSAHSCLLGTCKIALSRGEKAPESPSQAAVLRWALLSLYLEVCDKEMRPVHGQTREYGPSLITLPITSTSCLYLRACEWCLDDITGFA